MSTPALPLNYGFATWSGTWLSIPGRIEFDGHRFDPFPGSTVMLFLEVAHRARRGDASAAAMLRAFRVTIGDADGRPYWPMSAAQAEPAADPDHARWEDDGGRSPA